jgi:pimeloyl-ACP methyl ester carboxylesterase
LAAVLDHLKIPQADILAHSMGVSAALEFAHHFPGRARSLVLTSGTAARPLENLMGTNALQDAFSLMGRLYAKRPRLLQTLWYLQRRNPLLRTLIGFGGFNLHLTPRQDIDQYIDDVIKLGPEIFLCLIEDYARFDATGWLHHLAVPTFVIVGEKDGVIPPAQQEVLHQLIPGAKLWIVPRGSHCPQMDFPEAVTERIEEFVRQAGPRR